MNCAFWGNVTVIRLVEKRASGVSTPVRTEDEMILEQKALMAMVPPQPIPVEEKEQISLVEQVMTARLHEGAEGVRNVRSSVVWETRSTLHVDVKL
jgi:hypothetical protein